VHLIDFTGTYFSTNLIDGKYQRAKTIIVL
jgi:hypothetical protein